MKALHPRKSITARKPEVTKVSQGIQITEKQRAKRVKRKNGYVFTAIASRWVFGECLHFKNIRDDELLHHLWKSLSPKSPQR